MVKGSLSNLVGLVILLMQSRIYSEAFYDLFSQSKQWFAKNSGSMFRYNVGWAVPNIERYST